MLTCSPTSLFSWNFTVTGGVRRAELYFTWMSEQGAIAHGGDTYQVRKHGITSGQWTLEKNGAVIARAQKTSPFSRTFTLASAGHTYDLTARALARAFSLKLNGKAVGTLSPLHPFTRHATISCTSVVPELVQCFAFWLAVLTWRRAARSSKG